MFIFNLRKKIFVFSFLLLCIPTILMGVTSYYQANEELNLSGEIRLKNNVGSAIAMINELNDKVKKGVITLDQAQKIALTSFLGEMGPDGKRVPPKNVNLGKNGYMFVNDKKGMTLYHPLAEKEGKPSWDDQDKNGVFTTREIVHNGLNGGGFTHYSWTRLDNPNAISEKIVYSQMDPHWGWIVSAGTYMDDFNQGANHILYILFIVLGVEIAIGLFVSARFAKSITEPIFLVSNAMEQVAMGNLDVERIEIKNKDEIGKLAKSLNQMLINLKALIKQVSLNAEYVAAASEQLNVSVEQTAQASNQVTGTIQDMATGSEVQANYIEENKKAWQDILTGIQLIAESSGSVSKASAISAQESEQGNELVQRIIEQMTMIHTSVQNTGKIVKQLEQRSGEIVKIIGIITDISNQTNLLALNAAIEGARAGEHGRGFSVVAEQVRKLAEESRISADQISILIQEIQNNVARAVDAMALGTKEVESGMNVAEEVGRSFQRILDGVQHVNSQIQDVSSVSEKMATNSREVAAAINETARITKESALNSQTVASATEEQLASMEEIASSTGALSKIADELQKLTRKFKV